MDSQAVLCRLQHVVHACHGVELLEGTGDRTDTGSAFVMWMKVHALHMYACICYGVTMVYMCSCVTLNLSLQARISSLFE